MASKPQKISTVDITRDQITSKEYCNNSKHDYCTYITEFVEDKLNKNEELSEMLLSRYFLKVCNSVECWSYNYKTLLQLTNRIYETVTINDTLIKKILVLYNTEVFVLYINSLKNINTDKISALFKLIETIPYSETRIDINETLINYCISSKNQDILKLCFNIVIDINGDYNLIEKFLDLKLKPSEEQFFKILNIISNYEGNQEIIKKCILNGIEIKKDTLNKYCDKVCRNLDYDNFYGFNYFSDICIYLYKNGSTDITINDILNANRNKDKFINYLIDENYNISKDEFKRLCENKIIVKNNKKIEKFLDDEEIKTIIFNNDLPYKIKINYNIDILRAECLKRNNLKRITEIASSVKPDTICLENACSISGNIQTIKFLHNLNVPFTDKCVILYAKKNYYNIMMNYVIDTYNNENNIVMNDEY